MTIGARPDENRRRFNGQQRAALYLASGGCCEGCGIELESGWHADHEKPWSKGGLTDVINGQALCPTCNLKKGDKEENMGKTRGSIEPREWQLEAWDKYSRDKKNDWLLCATPGAGKTKWALGLARELLDRGIVERIVIVAPTQTIRDQWKNQNIVDLTSVQNEHGGLEHHEDFEGVVVTYAQVASQPDLQRMGCRKKTLVIFDEIHHAGFPNRSWGDQARHAFNQAIRRVGLTGTPWRRPGSGQIPFVSYNGQGQVVVDFAYEYGDAVRDGVCRAVEFRAFDGEVEYVYLDSCAQNTIVYTLEDEDDNTSVLRDLLKPDGAWLHSIVEKAIQELLIIRNGEDGEGAVPDAQGLVVADSQPDARAISKLLERMTGEKPEIIISDEPDSEQALERFRNGSCKWAVAVNKFSEGVDAPSLYVGVYATRKKTPLIFRQIVGRFVRRRSGEDRPAVLFMPAVPSLKTLASEIENELRHEVDIEREEYERERAIQDELELATTEKSTALPTEISVAELDTVIVGGKSYKRAEYTEAETYAKQYGIPQAYIVNIAELLRTLGKTTSIPEAAQEPREAKTTKDKYKKALLRRVEQEARKKALALHVDFKEFNISLSNRFGKRRELSIPQLEEELHWLEQLNTGAEISV